MCDLLLLNSKKNCIILYKKLFNRIEISRIYEILHTDWIYSNYIKENYHNFSYNSADGFEARFVAFISSLYENVCVSEAFHIPEKKSLHKKGSGELNVAQWYHNITLHAMHNY